MVRLTDMPRTFLAIRIRGSRALTGATPSATKKSVLFQPARETAMRTLIAAAAALFGAVAIGLWLNSDSNSATEMSSVSKPTVPAAISILEIHNQAHLEFLPIQQIEDQSVFSEARR